MSLSRAGILSAEEFWCSFQANWYLRCASCMYPSLLPCLCCIAMVLHKPAGRFLYYSRIHVIIVFGFNCTQLSVEQDVCVRVSIIFKYQWTLSEHLSSRLPFFFSKMSFFEREVYINALISSLLFFPPFKTTPYLIEEIFNTTTTNYSLGITLVALRIPFSLMHGLVENW